jgi:hypothetical protein
MLKFAVHELYEERIGLEVEDHTRSMTSSMMTDLGRVIDSFDYGGCGDVAIIFIINNLIRHPDVANMRRELEYFYEVFESDMFDPIDKVISFMVEYDYGGPGISMLVNVEAMMADQQIQSSVVVSVDPSFIKGAGVPYSAAVVVDYRELQKKGLPMATIKYHDDGFYIPDWNDTAVIPSIDLDEVKSVQLTVLMIHDDEWMKGLLGSKKMLISFNVVMVTLNCGLSDDVLSIIIGYSGGCGNCDQSAARAVIKKLGAEDLSFITHLV